MLLDLLVIALIIMFCIVSYNRGLVIALYKLFGGIISLVLAFFLYKIVASALGMTELPALISEFVAGYLVNLDIVEGVQAQAAEIRENLAFLPDAIVNMIIQNNNYEVYSVLEVNNLIDYVAVSIGNLIINAISIVIAWILSTIGLSIVVSGVDLVTKLPVLNVVNKLAGAVIGFINIILIIWIFCLIVPFLIEMPSLVWFRDMWETSFILQWFYNNNFLLDYLTSLTVNYSHL
ncbi:MAG: hypothetical protein ATN33_04065 [Epulopiscium sp. Nele67-Bin001]|nr:MAG: hypothetical protein ATN33_04065 [Epulopiscium sp. Nele67-Bin001]